MALTKTPIIFLTGVFLFVLDQVLKYFSYTFPQSARYIVEPWLGWEYFGNPGIAFGIMLPNWIVLVGTPLLLGVLFSVFKKNISFLYAHIGFVFIVCGALSNYIDRLFFGVTIDYFRIGTSIINLADVMIVTGLLNLIITPEKKKDEDSALDVAV
jgi:signal peptidase II